MSTRLPYSTDLTDEEWVWLEGLVPEPKAGGRPAKYARREIMNAIVYLLRNGCAWRNLPHDFPSWRSVYSYFRTWRLDGTWQKMHECLRGDLRQIQGRARQPSASILESQSVKTTEKGGRAASMRASK